MLLGHVTSLFYNSTWFRWCGAHCNRRKPTFKLLTSSHISTNGKEGGGLRTLNVVIRSKGTSLTSIVFFMLEMYYERIISSWSFLIDSLLICFILILNWLGSCMQHRSLVMGKLMVIWKTSINAVPYCQLSTGEIIAVIYLLCSFPISDFTFILLIFFSFPYVKTRIKVVEREQKVLQPIQVAIDDIEKKTRYCCFYWITLVSCYFFRYFAHFFLCHFSRRIFTSIPAVCMWCGFLSQIAFRQWFLFMNCFPLYLRKVFCEW